MKSWLSLFVNIKNTALFLQCDIEICTFKKHNPLLFLISAVAQYKNTNKVLHTWKRMWRMNL